MAGALSAEQRKRLSESLKGRTFTVEHRRHISEARLKMAKEGRLPDRPPMSEETKRKIGAARQGKPLSEETRQKMREARARYCALKGIGRFKSEESKQAEKERRRASRKASWPQYRAKHREEDNKRNKESRLKRIAADPEAERARNREMARKARGNPARIYDYIASECKRKHRRCGIRMTRQEFVDWYTAAEKICVFCDITVNYLHLLDHARGRKRLSIDRIDNDRGYELGNLQLACLTCNRVKSNIFSNEEMRRLSQEFIKPKWKARL